MKFDVLIIRIGFVLLLALGGYLLNPLGKSSHLNELVGESVRLKQSLSGVFGALVAIASIGVVVRARKASL